MSISELLEHISPPSRRGIFVAVVGGLVLYLIQKWREGKKAADNPGGVKTGDIQAGGNVNIAGGNIINITVASEEDLRKRFPSLAKEKEEKIKSCFIPGVRELEAGRKLLQYGQEAKAKYHLEEAIKFFICAADALPCYETYLNLASAYNDYCDYDNAKENYQKAIQHDPSQPGGYNGLGIVYGKTGDYPQAEEYFSTALAATAKLTDRQAKLVWQATALNNLGNVYRETGQMEQAREHYQQAQAIFQEIGAPHLAKQVDENLAKLGDRD